MRRSLLVLPLLLIASLVTPAAAQEGPGWLYVGLDGEIVAMRPDGSDQRNLTSTGDRWEDHPDVSDFSGRDLITQFQLFDDEGEPSRQGGLHYINPVSEGQDFDPLSGSFVADTYAPSWGYDASRFFISEGGNEIGAIYLFEGRQESVVDSGGSENGHVDPDGTPDGSVQDEVIYTFTLGGRLGGLRLRNFGEAPTDLLIAAGQYAEAGFGRYYAGGSQVIFSCRLSDGGALQLCRSAPDQAGTGFTAIPTPVDAINAAVSPDGTQIAFRGTDGSVWVAGIDGSDPVALVGSGASGEGLDWGQEIPLRGGPAPDPEPEPEPEPPADPAPNTPLVAGGTDGDPSTTDRASFTDPGPYSAAVSQARYPSTTFAGDGGPQYVLLSRDDDFADSLAGSALSGSGPILFTAKTGLDASASGELQRLLPPGGTVYLLGGVAALEPAVEQAVRDLGLTPVRLEGPSRFETAVEVAREVIRLGGSTEEILIARGTGVEGNPTAAWADSVTGGVYAAANQVPVVVTPTDFLHPVVDALVDEVGASATLLGGEAALTPAVAAELPGSRRIAGADRADTAGQIATQLLGYDAQGDRVAFVFNGFHEDGWTFGLAGAGLAADAGAALLVTNADALLPVTEALLTSCDDPSVETLVLGWRTIVSDAVVAAIDALEGAGCG